MRVRQWWLIWWNKYAHSLDLWERWQTRAYAVENPVLGVQANTSWSKASLQTVFKKILALKEEGEIKPVSGTLDFLLHFVPLYFIKACNRHVNKKRRGNSGTLVVMMNQ